MQRRDGVGERVHGVDDELRLRVQLVDDLRLVEVVAADGQVGRVRRLVGGRRLEARRQDAVVQLLPVVGEPRVAPVVLRREREHVLDEAGDGRRLQVDRDGALGHVLEALDELVLAPPAVARHPQEVVRVAEAFRGGQQSPENKEKRDG